MLIYLWLIVSQDDPQVAPLNALIQKLHLCINQLEQVCNSASWPLSESKGIVSPWIAKSLVFAERLHQIGHRNSWCKNHFFIQFIPDLLSRIDLAIMLVIVHLLEELGIFVFCWRHIGFPETRPWLWLKLNFNFLTPTICITLVCSSCFLHLSKLFTILLHSLLLSLVTCKGPWYTRGSSWHQVIFL